MAELLHTSSENFFTLSIGDAISFAIGKLYPINVKATVTFIILYACVCFTVYIADDLVFDRTASLLWGSFQYLLQSFKWHEKIVTGIAK
jgi:hypothetical protein